ncbi:hypothetical protein FDI69_gp030 [Rhodococcus phage Trina]|uniref:Uncharacterized protein n=1 Tax=Rhodococcus phage Trina TaxID=2027905 RepID=A0A2D1ADR3_9CAUD|nr:hypothetical protein FDI69_gp030 [Rhodococcus phage Trina]ASZ74847.1 hypothetical protein SEA_TRINA_30 [Rhodococcus phage Trina]
MNNEQMGVLTTLLQQILDVQMMQLRSMDEEAAATVNMVHNDLNMFMFQDWEPVARARELVDEMKNDI